MKAILASAFVILILAGCKSINTKTTNFYIPGYKSEGSIIVLSTKQELNDSLEFANYKAKFEAKLVQAGYTIANTPTEAKYIAFVSYGIDDGKGEVTSIPIFGQTSGGSTFSSGSIYGSGGSTNFSGSTYSMPTYGMVGSLTGSRTVYTRVIALDIVDAQSLKDGHPQKILEGRANSTGSCGVIAGVFDEILEAMFKQFPGKSGKVQSVKVSSKGGC